MIYPFVRVPVPNISSYVQCRNGKRYLFAYVGPRVVNSKGKSIHPTSKLIGRLETNEDGIDELMEITPPVSAVTEGAGRKSSVKGTAPKEVPAFL